MEVSAVGWVLTLGVVGVLLAVDLAVGVLRPHAVGFREASAWSVFYVAVALAYGVVVGLVAGWDFGGQYLTGYVVEKSLSVDNLFVFVVILGSFGVPREHQQKVLTFGIVAALVLRGVLIAAGAALLSAFSLLFLVFGLVLLWTAVQLARHGTQEPDVEGSAAVRLARRVLPLSEGFDGGRLTTRRAGRRVATPLALVLVAVGATDVLFALDSVPAVFGVTQEALLVFAANAFALLGLRALYFLVSGLLERLVHLATGLAVVLGLIGVKLVLHWAHGVWPGVPTIPTPLSLAVILGVLAVTTATSLRATRVRDDAAALPAADARCGSRSAAP
ncbi:tellurite resistance protein TerC [Motilibacter rhizosphaerae]|uniref:Tellurite resistance protein TerC n=1 Tax=Motilibacter rhizosphaerae TaxID=598652 RepID=A0A4Q7NR01_9ACTN|nr:TerC/Alx family metal homeostasis membrane protein [Motilibacter rhizosphaerae]RZS89477.1 tellurite resistance protein TerC [Motilibacter rhizosphaerae]